MFSTLPKVADKAFIIAFLLPMLAFALAAELAFRPWPETEALAKALWADKDITQLALLAGTLWLAAMALMMTNRLIHRFLSGYVWPLKNEDALAAMRGRWSEAAARINADATRLAGVRADDTGPLGLEVAAHNLRLYAFRRTFPRTEGQVLATRFGNANRAYERYANRVYGVDGVALWPRLTAVIGKEMQTGLGDARAQVDCFVNLVLLSAVIGVWALGVWAARTFGTEHAGAAAFPTLAWAAGGLLLCRLSYEMAIERARALGEQTRAAVDLYLPALVAQLGHAQPDNLEGQKALLAELQDAWLYYTPVRTPWVGKGPAKAVDDGVVPPGDD